MATATAVAAPVATAAAPVKKVPKQLPAPNSDFYQLVDVLTAEEKAILKKVRTYMETKVQPIIQQILVRRCVSLRAAAVIQGAGPRRAGI